MRTLNNFTVSHKKYTVLCLPQLTVVRGHFKAIEYLLLLTRFFQPAIDGSTPNGKTWVGSFNFARGLD